MSHSVCIDVVDGDPERRVPRPTLLYRIRLTDWREVTRRALTERVVRRESWNVSTASAISFKLAGGEAFAQLVRPWRSRDAAAQFICPFVREWLDEPHA